MSRAKVTITAPIEMEVEMEGSGNTYYLSQHVVRVVTETIAALTTKEKQ